MTMTMADSKAKSRNSSSVSVAELNFLHIIIVLQALALTHGNGIQYDHRVSEDHYSTKQNIISEVWIISKELCATKNQFFYEPTSAASKYCSCNTESKIHSILCSCNSTLNEIIELRLPPPTSNLYLESAKLKIQNCWKLNFDTATFSKLQRTLVELVIDNVQEIDMSSNTDEGSDHPLDLGNGGSSSAANRTITFKNVRIPQIPSNSFPSVLDRVEFINSKIDIISTKSFPSNRLRNVLFENSTVGILQSNSFAENTEMNVWTVKNSNFAKIESHAIGSSMGFMSWTDSWIGRMETLAMSGIIANISFQRNTINVLESNGMSFKGWTWVTLLNNTFEYVNKSGIDLTKYATNYSITEINGNSWHKVESDFILVGQTDIQLALVLNNTFTQLCDCAKPFLSVSLTASKPWLYDKLRNNSQCVTSAKGAVCMNQDEPVIAYDQWTEFCSTPVFLCINELTETSDVSYAPSLTSSKLRILVILIGAIALTIVACLIGVLCIYMCRSRRPPSTKQKMNGCGTTKSSSCSPPHSYVDLMPSSKLSQMNLTRPRSMLIEDVEMEDKGVQTMPSELSTDVLEELRGKLSHPDSFWDAKETIDHLYDLIQVQPYKTTSASTTALSSPPDVTMCNSGMPSKFNTTKPTKESTMTQTSKPIPFPRYAQVKGKSKTAPICEYGDPSDSQMHVYSELNLLNIQNPQPQNGLPVACNESRSRRPIVCDYTEPKDVHTHVYAELGISTAPDPNSGAAVPYTQSLHRVPAQHQHHDPHFLTLAAPPSQMRPLPSIPSSSSLLV